ncbi:methylmalonate-semialdehyde dehydrogenase [acylating], mitochondrial-like [Papaver somniferum]|uniref:methylmalonate-semialdehyde dehydrogenase [acylating], mitochondrial-like n=1 Tax=Papaver somniferum TaxID=3469 RepID=UPI000E70471C|nr:methylmalonate-semialdehyde dehydrogenase [acylating], mitochondrial-like [Papaver somniferum]
MFKLKQLTYRDMDIHGMGSLQMRDFVANVSNGIDTYSIREPPWVCAGIFPSNFLEMTSLLMFPMTVTCKNASILKPSEPWDPGPFMILSIAAMKLVWPSSFVDIMHGSYRTINNCIDGDNEVISIVDSIITTSTHIYIRTKVKEKCVHPDRGVKNHAIVIPYASMGITMNSFAGFGACSKNVDEPLRDLFGLIVPLDGSRLSR